MMPFVVFLVVSVALAAAVLLYRRRPARSVPSREPPPSSPRPVLSRRPVPSPPEVASVEFLGGTGGEYLITLADGRRCRGRPALLRWYPDGEAVAREIESPLWIDVWSYLARQRWWKEAEKKAEENG